METTNKSGIYQITNLVNGKVYIGSSVDLRRREWQHFCSPKDSNLHLQRAMKKYGKQNFRFEVLKDIADVEQLESLEQFYIDQAKSKGKILYNTRPEATNNVGIQYGPMSESHKNSLSVAAKARWSQPGEVEKQSTRAKVRWSDSARRLDQSKKMDGRTKGEPRPYVSVALKGKTHSVNCECGGCGDEARKKNSESNKRRWQEPRYRERMSELIKAGRRAPLAHALVR